MFGTDIDWDPSRPVFEAETDFTAKVRLWAKTVDNRLLDAVKQKSPVRTGELRESWTKTTTNTTDGADVLISNESKHAEFVVHGTSPHRIEPKRAMALHFHDAAGMEVFARFVNHPGTRPNHFVVRAVDTMMPELRSSFRDAVTKGL